MGVSMEWKVLGDIDGIYLPVSVLLRCAAAITMNTKARIEMQKNKNKWLLGFCSALQLKC